jgi:phosphopantothenoylcysteine decarboxylase / phosphopantothenate---cysteine ligase
MRQSDLLAHRKYIITGGPTREWLDPVRFISNRSSGKMGIALADVAAEISSRVVFIHGPIEQALLAGKNYKTVAIETTEELLRAVMQEIEPEAVLIMAAAPGDYRPVEASSRKIKKHSSEFVLRLQKNPDILQAVAARRVKDPALHDMRLVGFAAETDNVEEYGKQKLIKKKLDMICVNNVSQEGAGFASDTNIVTLYTRNGDVITLPKMAKREVAARIIEAVISLL